MDKIVLSRRSFVALPIVLAACKGSVSVLDFAGPTMGTTFSIRAIDHSNRITDDMLRDAVEQALITTNKALSNWDSGSEVSRFNAARSTGPISVSQPLYDVARAAEDVRQASEGRFDVALGPLIELWGFGSGGQNHVAPTESQIADARARTGQGGAVVLGDGTLRKAHADDAIFLSAIGKGYGVDAVANAIRSLGIDDFMVEIGGDLYASGRNQDGLPWQIGVETPDSRSSDLQKVVGLRNHGMATSGDYRNYFEVDGQRYSHILDAETGRPVAHQTASATVVTENAMLADAWATAMLVLGSVKGMEIAANNDLAVLFVDRTEDGFAASASPKFAALTS